MEGETVVVAAVGEEDERVHRLWGDAAAKRDLDDTLAGAHRGGVLHPRLECVRRWRAVGMAGVGKRVGRRRRRAWSVRWRWIDNPVEAPRRAPQDERESDHKARQQHGATAGALTQINLSKDARIKIREGRQESVRLLWRSSLPPGLRRPSGSRPGSPARRRRGPASPWRPPL